MWFATAFVMFLTIAELILFATIKINHLKEKNKEKIKETSATTATTKEDQVDAFIQTCDLSQKQDKSTFLSYLYGFFSGQRQLR